MKILLINSPEHNTDHLYTLLVDNGVGVKKTNTIETAEEMLQKEEFESVILPVTNNDFKIVRPLTTRLRRATRKYAYIVTLTLSKETLSSGANLTLSKEEVSNDTVKNLNLNIQNLGHLITTIGNDSIDFPSAGGIIARSAFNQLFLSCLDRSNRYAELSSILEISLENYQELFNYGGNYIADYATAALSQKCVDIRRQSDIIGQIQHNTFSLLLQVPKDENEGIQAATRFAETFAKDQTLKQGSPTPLGIRITLTEVPTGRLKFDKFVTPE